MLIGKYAFSNNRCWDVWIEGADAAIATSNKQQVHTGVQTTGIVFVLKSEMDIWGLTVSSVYEFDKKKNCNCMNTFKKINSVIEGVSKSIILLNETTTAPLK